MASYRDILVMRAKLVHAGKLARYFWRRACEHDGVPPGSMFVEFSPNNPWAGPAGRATVLVQQLLQTYHP